MNITNPAPPITRERVSFPPGTNWGGLGESDESEYLSDQDIAPGRIPNNTNTAANKKINNKKIYKI